MASTFWHLSTDEAATVERLVLDYVVTAYLHRPAGRPEPAITAAEIADYLAQHGACPEPVRGVPSWIYRVTYAAVKRLVRAGQLEASLTLVRGKETRVYNPTEVK